MMKKVEIGLKQILEILQPRDVIISLVIIKNISIPTYKQIELLKEKNIKVYLYRIHESLSFVMQMNLIENVMAI